ncbi:MAG: electron transfer flavoprotein subunit alpha/FixB family protein [Deltaproteobacteria bacterium]|jgi:electron transfer flavoprotein alpha subunit|nr:electron transfer flavoprotein subunit alpha/FixB family protein [Deltaproteobacteria bacterium]
MNRIQTSNVILVLLEEAEQGLSPLSHSLLRAAGELAKQGQLLVYGLLVVGARGLPGLETFVSLGMSKIVAFSGLETPTAQQAAECLIAAIKRYRPQIVLVGANERGREIAPLAAAACRTGLTADCTGLRLENGLLIQTRPAFDGNLLAEIVTPLARPQMASVRLSAPADEGPGLVNSPVRAVEAPAALGLAPTAEILPAPKPARDLLVLNRTRLDSADDLEKAPVVVAAGLGLNGPEGVAKAAWLADKIGAALGGTRAVVERGWLPGDRQIGLSGRTIRPGLLIALGVSGSVQFMAGVGARTIVAVNSDPRAPILGLAQFGMVIELEELWPEFEEIFS